MGELEKATRHRLDVEERSATDREWEVFVREDGDRPLRHVGSVTAPTADAAHETATRLFAWFATDVWLCPADGVRRYTTHDLADDRTEATPESGSEPRTLEYE